MLTQLTVSSTSSLLGSILELHMDARIVTDLIQVRDIAGLDPVKATVNTTQYGSIDGSYFTGASVADRNIVVTVGYNPDWGENTVESLRQSLYQYFMPKQAVALEFESTHLPTVKIEGVVESITPNIFAQDPEVAVSIICPDPAFVGVDNVVVDGVVTVPHPGLTFTPIAYIGSVETSFDIILSKGAGADYTGLIHIINSGAVQTEFTVTGTVDTNDNLEFNSTDGSRLIDSINNTTGVRTSLIKQIGAGINWVKLNPGQNSLAVAFESGDGGQSWEMTYIPRFGGL